MSEAKHSIASPEAAWANGVAAAGKGDFAAALRWLARAVRLAPNDPRIALDLANIRLQSGMAREIAKAAEDFSHLSAQYDVAPCWLGLLAARRLLQDHAGAASALHELLSRHCVPEDTGFAEVASAMAQAAGHAGWCGVDAQGRLHLSAETRVLRNGEPAELAHLSPAPETGTLTVENFLGSPLNLACFTACEGMVEVAGTTLMGWVSRPAAPMVPPMLRLQDGAGRLRNIIPGGPLPADADAPLTPRHWFRWPTLGLEPPFEISGPGGAPLFGSPAHPTAILSALPLPAEYRGPPNKILPPPAKLCILVPVYRGLALTQACLKAARAAAPEAELIVVDDATPEPELAAWLDEFCTAPNVRLLRHAQNLGFPAAANAGLNAAAGCDVLLLNSDALLPPNALATLRAALYADAETGSVTPFANEATICSYPKRGGGNPAPDLAGAIALDALAFAASGAATAEIPTGVGFCMLMRHDCIETVGHFRPEFFAQGYGEEVDWCLRARHRGFRHMAATGAYVAHVSEVSFTASGRRAAARALNRRNNRLLEKFYPGYETLIDAHLAADPLAPARRDLDAKRFAANARPRAVLLISHNHGGGVTRRIRQEMREIRESGSRPLLLRPALLKTGPNPYAAELTDDLPGDTPNLRFTLPEEEHLLLAALAGENITHAVLHHALGHHASMRRIAEKLGLQQDLVVHDYASFCPRVHLIGANLRYCGEPAPAACVACVAEAGDETAEGLALQSLLARSRTEFGAARRIIAPSADTSRRIARHFPKILPEIVPWEDDTRNLPLRAPRNGARRIAVIGGIGRAKGYDVVKACAEDAGARRLQLEFMIVGSTYDDEKLLAAGRIFVTGAYEAEALPELLETLSADLAFIPSIWPETWCYTLSEAWEAGLYTVAFDLGAQGERIAATHRGLLLPLGLPAPRINDALMNWRPPA